MSITSSVIMTKDLDIKLKCKQNVYVLLEEVFESSILEADLTDSINNLTELYASFSGQGFESSFEDILMLTINESRRSKDVQNIFRFISEFVVFIDKKFKEDHAKIENNSDNEECDAVHPFLQYLFKTLYCWSQATSYVIRFRSCQLLYMILTNILDIGVGEIDVNTFEKIAKLIQARRKDISANVRAHSVLLAKFFQDPSDHNDPVIAGLCWQLQNDPNPRVRQNIVEIIAACEETIGPVTGRFLSDKNSLVRNAALLHICHRISPRSYTTQQRILILNQCFNDNSTTVRQNAEQKLIPIWFRAYGDKLCPFMKSLRLGNECLDSLPFCKELVRLLFKFVKISQILEEIDLDVENALPKSLNGEKIFIWRHFYTMVTQKDNLKKFVPKTENLVEFITKCIKESTLEDNEAYTYKEFIVFIMDALDINEDEKCDQLPLLAIDIIKNLFVPREVIPYAVGFYCEYAHSDAKDIHNDLLQVVNELYQFVGISDGIEQKRMILKCLDVFSEILAQDFVSVNAEMITIKDELVFANCDSDDEDIKAGALRALSLYCLLDLEEAKQLWPFIEKTLYENSSKLKEYVLKDIFDILKCHGNKLFDQKDGKIMFDDVLENLLSHVEGEEIDMNIVLKGMFKLFLSHHTYSHILMGRLILFMFHPIKGQTTKTTITNFLQLYGESKEEAECLTQSFLNIINILFQSKKTSAYHKTSIKVVAHHLLEFSKVYEENKNFEIQDKFEDLLVLKVTKQFLKHPHRLSAIDLYGICDHIFPKDVEKQIKLMANVKVIIESLDSSALYKNAFTKRSIKLFTTYMKKIQAIMDVPSDDEHESHRLDLTPGDSFLANVAIKEISSELVSPLLSEKELSF